MSKFKYHQGSIWRRWDLHVHSPDSALANHFEGNSKDEKWSNYLKALGEIKDISVLGITDYYSVSGYKRLREEKARGKLANIDFIIPNVETRLDIRTESDGTINLHFIFNPEIVNELDARFFLNLEFEYSGRHYKCTKEELINLGRAFNNDQSLDEDAAFSVGVTQFKISSQKIRDLFKKDPDLRANCFIVIPNSSKDGNSGVQEGGFAAIREELYRISDAIFSGNPNDHKYFLGDGADLESEVIRKCGSLKPCVHGSDAHSLSKIGKPDHDRFCWIKADPSFEGLKQIIIEPKTRVLIQEANPLEEFKRSYISSISASLGKVFQDSHVETSEFKISLNPYMVSIIGGRGTGKSLLLDMIKKTFDIKSKGRPQKIDHKDFEVRVCKSDGEELVFHLGSENFFDYLHVSQGDVKSVVADIEKLDREIKQMIGMPIDNLSISDEDGSQTEKIVEIKELFDQLDEDGEKKYSKTKYENLIKKNLELIKTITTKENKTLIECYSKNQTAVGIYNKNNEKLEKILVELNSFQNARNTEILEFNNLFEEIKIPEINFKSQTDSLDQMKEKIAKDIQIIEDKNQKIKHELKEKGVEGDIIYLLEKVEEYQQNIIHYKGEVTKIEELEESMSLHFEKLKEKSEKIHEDLKKYIADIDLKWVQLKNGKEGWSPEQKQLNSALIKDVSVSGKISFDKKRFYEIIIEGLNRGKFRAGKGETVEDKLQAVFNVETVTDYFKLLGNEDVITLGDNLPVNLESFLMTNSFVKNGELDFLRGLFAVDSRTKYLRAITQIEYMGKAPDQLSVGQRGTFYLCLKLATNVFGSTLIFDQPEDDLDNNFIVHHLIPLLRKIKKFRQVILVTHNANVVVNSDSEQVIVASNVGERLYYVSGSIENSFVDEVAEGTLNKQGIKQHVCDILEGGLDAFRSREKRYDL